MSTTRPPQRRGLGRGLGSLIPTAPVSAPSHDDSAAPEESASSSGGDLSAPGAPAAGRNEVREAPEGSQNASPDGSGGLAPVDGAYFAEIPIEQIVPNRAQPRSVFDEEAMAELVHSINEIGLLQPVVVRRTGPEAYELIMGERRWRASQVAGRDTIPAIVRDTDDTDMLRDALLENLHRSDLNPLEEASAYAQLLEDFGCTHEELARRLGRSRPQISNTLRLLKLSPAVQRRVAAGVLSAGHARSLLAVEDPALQDRLAQRVVAEGISVRGLEEIVAVGERGRAPSPRGRSAQRIPPGLVEYSDRLADRFETRVKVDLGRSKGKITVEFATMEDLQRIVDIMDPRNRTDRVI
ncbi:ParB/RepB/Spo0J family partition protein [Nocardioides sp. dk4132]|uniref:ParB/RepB/Spo0J family partition protein n=1 Tax=unclassified Nocardioides TaxID=2615069 RepID=UPI001297ABD6|nr:MULTISPECIES: ParB/RepB/Spo0J family partition protein [unclassified Nocardioides]MQW77059.1 ParB/RepB/Spo0J family partition protein [Nocardioides sp. dk4132]QGA09464.1 ParB/RepB/Spo0J family partition protein [Nocardioides sp. dk884]